MSIYDDSDMFAGFESVNFPDPPMPPFPTNTSFFEPLELYMPVAILQEATKKNLEGIQDYLNSTNLSSEQLALLETAKIQRQKFLVWLDKLPTEHAYIAMYPALETILEEK